MLKTRTGDGRINRKMAFLKEPIDCKFFILGSSSFNLETQYRKKVA